MAIDVRWDNPECTIICWYFPKQWNIDDLSTAEQETNQMLGERSETIIDLIINVENSSQWPDKSFVSFKKALTRITRKQGLKIIVGSNTFLETLFTTLSKTHKEFAEGLTFVESMDEARDLLLT